MKLTPATLSALQDTPQALSELTSICLPDRGITSIEDISAATDLRKVDLHGNSLKNADSLAGLRYCTGITWLHLAGNDYGNVCPPGTVLEKMRGLKVLNMSNNRIVRFSVPDLSRLSALNALILSHNEIPVLEKDTFAALRNLNTLVLSHNKLGVLPEGMFATMANLKKLSLAHNQLKFFPIGLPTNLQELRLNDNKIPTPSMKPQFPPSLQLLDVGNNLLQSLEPSLGLALSTLPNLVNLNMKGNPVCKLPGYRESVLLACSESGKGTGLRILDGNRFDEKFLQRKKKMDAAKRKKETKEKKELNLKKASTAADETPDKGKGSNRSVPPKGVKRKALSDGVSGGELAKAKKLRRESEPPEIPERLGRPAKVAGDGSHSKKLVSDIEIVAGDADTNEDASSKAKKTRRGKRGGKGAANVEVDNLEELARPAKNGSSQRTKGPVKELIDNPWSTLAELAKSSSKSSSAGLKRNTAPKLDRDRDREPNLVPEVKAAKKAHIDTASKSGLGGGKNKPEGGRAVEKPASKPTAPHQPEQVGKFNVAVPRKDRQSSKPVQKQPEQSEEALLAARSGVVAVIEAEPARKKKAGAATAFDPSVLESSDGFGTAIAGWD